MHFTKTYNFSLKTVLKNKDLSCSQNWVKYLENKYCTRNITQVYREYLQLNKEENHDKKQQEI